MSGPETRRPRDRPIYDALEGVLEEPRRKSDTKTTPKDASVQLPAGASCSR
jgi:hypothetical protein